MSAPTNRSGGAEPDTGFRRIVVWTLIALVCAVLFSLLAVSLVIRWFDKG